MFASPCVLKTDKVVLENTTRKKRKKVIFEWLTVAVPEMLAEILPVKVLKVFSEENGVFGPQNGSSEISPKLVVQGKV